MHVTAVAVAADAWHFPNIFVCWLCMIQTLNELMVAHKNAKLAAFLGFQVLKDLYNFVNELRINHLWFATQ